MQASRKQNKTKHKTKLKKQLITEMSWAPSVPKAQTWFSYF